jgi:DNA invertase Pin-like site-specific DNA recombinase
MFDVLVVARLDRLSRSVGNFAVILDRAKAHGWKVVCLDPMVDMTTPFGEAMAGMAAVFAQLEHRLISQRQIESVAARRAAGTYAPAGQAARRVPDQAIRRMVRLSQRGMTSQAIARQLKIEGHHPPNGGQWKPRLVRKYVAQRRSGHELLPAPRRRLALLPVLRRGRALQPRHPSDHRDHRLVLPLWVDAR